MAGPRPNFDWDVDDYDAFINMRQWLVFFKDRLGLTHTWPNQLRILLLSKTHLNNRERFTVVVFLLVNAFDPRAIRAFIRFRYRHLDASAWRQIEYVIYKYPSSTWTAWNCTERRTTR